MGAEWHVPASLSNKDIVPDDWKVKTNEIQDSSSEKIAKNLQSLWSDLLQNDLEQLARKDPNIKKLFEIPEFENITLKWIFSYEFWNMELYISVDFDGDLYHNLLKYFDRKQLVPDEIEPLRIVLYWWRLQIDLEQIKTS
ncbi:MAG: hypothetical protein ACD_80C00174G0028 [uncultured bacterium (gcode 4)]|uniref:Uncharacterized protein n=1 Tax=uncultured bacterium (gcode 4) TaxID=1234023 RepID=K1XWA5_9BACT|nr:MAG: hypothetical protein ACD_80C00174G0028 [uncultured bacterium (gcode 4)]